MCYFVIISQIQFTEALDTTDERDKWRMYVHGVANSRTEDG